MAELVLHIGTKKTGTTFLQRYLRANVAELQKVGWTYPEFFNDENHIALVLPFQHKVTRYHKERSMIDAKSKAQSAEQWAAILAERVKPDARWIITSENFSSRLQSAPEVHDVFTFLRRFFDTITVVVSFRRQDFVFPSLYAQSVKANGYTNWSWEFCQRHLAKFDYYAMYQRWSAAFGSHNLHSLPYLESSKTDNAQILARFAVASGIEFGPDWEMPTEAIVNPSLSAEGIAFLRAVKPAVPRWNLDNSSNQGQRQLGITRLMELTPGPSFRPGPEVIDRLTHYYSNSNADLLEKLPHDDLWQEWLGQPKSSTEHQSAVPGISSQRVDELMLALSGPGAPVDWVRVDPAPKRLRRRISGGRRMRNSEQHHE